MAISSVESYYRRVFERTRNVILGMSTETYTLVHVIISLVGIASGLVVMFGLVGGKRFDAWTALFLATTVATSVTGFGFPFHKVTPAIVVGILSLVLLALSILGRSVFHLAGGWRRTYVITAVIALYFNVFVLIVQSFEKAPALRKLAPTQSEPPFLIAQVIVLVLFVVIGIRAVKGFHEPAVSAVKAR